MIPKAIASLQNPRALRVEAIYKILLINRLPHKGRSQ